MKDDKNGQDRSKPDKPEDAQPNPEFDPDDTVDIEDDQSGKPEATEKEPAADENVPRDTVIPNTSRNGDVFIRTDDHLEGPEDASDEPQSTQLPERTVDLSTVDFSEGRQDNAAQDDPAKTVLNDSSAEAGDEAAVPPETGDEQQTIAGDDPGRTAEIGGTDDSDEVKTVPEGHVDATVEFDSTVIPDEPQTGSISTRDGLPGTVDSKSLLYSANVTATVNPRDLSAEEQRAWDAATGRSGDDVDTMNADSSYEEVRSAPKVQQSFHASNLQILGRTVLPVQSSPSESADYRLVRLLGEGGMGAVYVARQGSLDRLVAVKVIKPLSKEEESRLSRSGRLQSTQQRRRDQFLSEAVVTGDLDHPNIVPIHDVATTSGDGTLFYSMKRVVGTPWDKVIGNKKLDENLEIWMKVADAIGFAHSRGVVHRDIKPENVMLGDFGEVLVMDWGLAIATPEFQNKGVVRTVAGLGGSPAYMAPEMATGPLNKIGPAADVYLLGAVLFEIITGRPPHTGTNLSRCLRAAATNEIVDVDPKHHGELFDIALKALNSSRKKRYASVPEMQDAIRQYRSHAESISLAVRAGEDLELARRSGEYNDYARAVFGYEEAKSLWEENHTAAEGLSRARLAYAEAAYANQDFDLGLSLIDPNDPNHQAIAERLRAGQRERESRQSRLAWARRTAAALIAIIFVGGAVFTYAIEKERQKAENAAIAEREAKEQEAIEKQKAIDARKAEELAKDAALASAKIAREAEQKAKEAEEKAKEDRQVALDAKKLAEEAEAAERTARLEQERLRIEAEVAEANAKDAQQLAQRERERAEYESYIAQINLAQERIEQNEFSDARRILTQLRESDSEENLPLEWHLLWQRANESTDAEPAEQGGVDLSVVGDGRSGLVTTGRGSVKRIRITETGEIEPAESNVEIGENITATSVAADGGRIAIGDIQGRIQILDADGRELGDPYGDAHLGEITALRFLDATRLVSAGVDRAIRVWDIETGQQLAAGYHIAPVVDIAAVSTDDKDLVIAAIADDNAGKVAVWSVDSQEEFGARRIAEFLQHTAPVLSVAVSPDGRYAASADRSGQAFLWETAKARTFDYQGAILAAVDSLSGPDTPPPNSSIEGTELIDRDGGPRLQLVSKETPNSSQAHRDAIAAIRFSPDGSKLVTASDDFTLKVWSVPNGRKLETLRGHGGWVRDAAFVPGREQLLVSTSTDGSVRTWQLDQTGSATLADSNERVAKRHSDQIWSARFNHDGTKIITASRDRTAKILSVDRSTNSFTPLLETVDEEEATLEEGTDFLAFSMAVDSEHNRLIISNADKRVRVWDIARGTEISSVSGTSPTLEIAMSSDGTLLLTGSSDPEISALVWKIAADGTIGPNPEHKLRGHTAAVTTLAVSPDGTKLLTGDRQGKALLWDAQSGTQIGEPINRFLNSRINAACFSTDNKSVFLASESRIVAEILVDTGEIVRELEHEGIVVDIDISPNAQQLGTVTSTAGGEDLRTQLVLWDLVNGQSQSIHELEGNSESVLRITSVQFASNGNWLIENIVSPDELGGEVIIRSTVRPKQSVRRLEFPELLDAARATISYGRDGLFTLNGESAFLWNLETGYHVQSYRPHGTVTQAGFSADSKYAITASRSIRIWDADTGQSLHKVAQPHAAAVLSVQFTPRQGEYTFATGGEDGAIGIWRFDPETQKITNLFKLDAAHADQPVRQIRFSYDGSQLLSVGDDAAARLWSVDDGKLVHTFRDQTMERGGFRCGAFSSDGAWIVVGSDDHLGRIWKTDSAGENEQPVAVLQGHADRIEDIVFIGETPENWRIVTASRDKSARLWDPQLMTGSTPRELLELRAHSQGLTAVDAADNGRLLLTAGRDGKVILWPAQ